MSIFITTAIIIILIVNVFLNIAIYFFYGRKYIFAKMGSSIAVFYLAAFSVEVAANSPQGTALGSIPGRSAQDAAVAIIAFTMLFVIQLVLSKTDAIYSWEIKVMNTKAKNEMAKNIDRDDLIDLLNLITGDSTSIEGDSKND